MIDPRKTFGINRREFMIIGGASAIVSPAVSRRAAARASQAQIFASCGADEEGRYFVAGFDGSGTVLFRLPIAERGHEVAFHPARAEAVAFARRPGMHMHVIDIAGGRMARTIEAAEDRHFFGHGVFSRDGARLYVTENDFDADAGVIGIYDPHEGYRRIGEFPSGGLDPHQLRLMPDGKTLVVANGGILTHPDTGRVKLNVEEMRPNLSLIDPASGARLWSAELPHRLHKLSIRHIDVNADGIIAFGMQYEGDVRDRVPLVALADAGGQVRYIEAPEGLEQRMRHYTGSVVFDRSGEFLAVSSPVGGVVGLWETESGKFIRDLPARDASGLSATDRAGTYLLTGGDGSIRTISASRADYRELKPADPTVMWDNHLAARGLPLSA